MELRWKKESISDVIGLILGVWLFVTPWIFGFVLQAASWNAWLSGVAVAALAIAALVAFAEWEEWVSLALGVWVAVAPWIVGYAGNLTATWVHLLTGIALIVVAALRLWFMHRAPPRVAA